MYEQKLVVFVDILGFSSLVEKSKVDESIINVIYDVVTYMMPENMALRSVGNINYDSVPKEEVKQVEEDFAQFSKAFLCAHPIAFTSFSDCLVISCSVDDAAAMQIVLDSLIKMNIYFWEAHSLLVRGGIVIGDVYHEDQGPVFGPAMSEAYLLESQKAIFPRLIISKEAIMKLRSYETFSLMEAAVNDDGDYESISLLGGYKYIVSTDLLMSSKQEFYKQNKATQLVKIQDMVSRQENIRVREKFQWLEGKFCQPDDAENFF